MSYPLSDAGARYPSGSTTASPAYSGTFIPEIWSAKLLDKFYDATVVAAIANTNWQGDISNYGDRVIIRTKPTLTINDYVAEQTLVYERPSSNVIDLLIDQGKYFNVILDDVLEMQADLDMMSLWAEDAAEQMKITIDTDVLSIIPGGAVVDNQGSSAGRISGNIDLGSDVVDGALTIAGQPADGEIDPFTVISRLGQVLDEQNIPETGRWIVAPADFIAAIKRSDIRDVSLTGDGSSMMRNGRIGMIDRFTIYSSNLLPAAPTAVGRFMLAGHSHGLTFASQLTKVETLRGESSFQTLMRGLQVYGRQVVDGKSLAAAVINVVGN